MSNAGYIRLHRKICDHDLWKAESFSKGQAWIDLLLNANYEDNVAYINGNTIEVSRGELAWSRLTMGKRWGWSRGKVNRFLNTLKKTGQLSIRDMGQLTTVVKVCKYDDYQLSVATGETTSGTKIGAQLKKERKNYISYSSILSHAIPENLEKLPGFLDLWHEWAKLKGDVYPASKKWKDEKYIGQTLDTISKAHQENMDVIGALKTAIERSWVGFQTSYFRPLEANKSDNRPTWMKSSAEVIEANRARRERKNEVDNDGNDKRSGYKRLLGSSGNQFQRGTDGRAGRVVAGSAGNPEPGTASARS